MITRLERSSERPWSVPVPLSDVPETGRHVELVADEATRAAMAGLAGLTLVSRLAAQFELTRHGHGGVHVVGHVSATVGQTCVVTLEPIENEIDETVDLIFAPADAMLHGDREIAEAAIVADDPPEVLRSGMVDLGAIATEFLLLGIDPYPRKPGAVFQAPAAADDTAHPFSALAALKKGQGGDGG